jgi:hypothetical protein
MGILEDSYGPEVVDMMKQYGKVSPELQKSARNNALMNAGFAMLASNGLGATRNQSLGRALGAGGLAGAHAYNSYMDDAQQKQAQQMQMAGQMEKLIGQRKKAQMLAQFRNGLPEQDRQLFDVAPEDYIKNMPQFQKQQLVEIADPNEPLRTQKVWMRPGEAQGTVAGLGSMPELLDPRIQAVKKDIAYAGRSQQNTNVFNNTKDDFKNERDLRNDFAGLPTTKAFNEVQSAYDQIQVAIKKESPAGDLAAATKIMKILDPGSVVRESELGMAMAATGALDRLVNYGDMVIKGTKLTPSQRKDFGQLSQQLYGAAADRYDQSVGEYRGVAKQYNLNEDYVAKPSKRSSLGSGDKKVVRRGTYGGKKVVEYSDGTINYAD